MNRILLVLLFHRKYCIGFGQISGMYLLDLRTSRRRYFHRTDTHVDETGFGRCLTDRLGRQAPLGA